MPAPIPVTVITGFLGAGKSTLLERWLAELATEHVAVIINERGDVAIDGTLLAGHAARIREIAGGCICCASQLALADALGELAESTPRFARILVETSGAASPAGVIRALTRGRGRDQLRLDGVVTVVDATRIAWALEQDLTIEQLGFADVVVLSHADQASDRTLETAEATLAPHAPGAVMTRAHGGTLAGSSSLLEILAAREHALHIIDASEPSRHHPIEAVSLMSDGALDEDRFSEWVENALGVVEARILRVKGILAIEGIAERVVLQGVAGSVEVSLGAPWGSGAPTSRLVVLGLGMDPDALRRGFAACAHRTETSRTETSRAEETTVDHPDPNYEEVKKS